jgi:hypothetical protein
MQYISQWNCTYNGRQLNLVLTCVRPQNTENASTRRAAKNHCQLRNNISLQSQTKHLIFRQSDRHKQFSLFPFSPSFACEPKREAAGMSWAKRESTNSWKMFIHSTIKNYVCFFLRLACLLTPGPIPSPSAIHIYMPLMSYTTTLSKALRLFHADYLELIVINWTIKQK